MAAARSANSQPSGDSSCSCLPVARESMDWAPLSIPSDLQSVQHSGVEEIRTRSGRMEDSLPSFEMSSVASRRA